MLTITTKETTLNNLGNLNIKGESDLYDNTGNKIGIVKIDLPNCKVQVVRAILFLTHLWAVAQQA